MCWDCVYMGAMFTQFTMMTEGDFDKALEDVRERVEQPMDAGAFCVMGISLIALELEMQAPPGTQMVVTRRGTISKKFTAVLPVIDFVMDVLQKALDNPGYDTAAKALQTYCKTHTLEDCITLAAVVVLYYFGTLASGVRVMSWTSMFEGNSDLSGWLPGQWDRE